MHEERSDAGKSLTIVSPDQTFLSEPTLYVIGVKHVIIYILRRIL